MKEETEGENSESEERRNCLGRKSQKKGGKLVARLKQKKEEMQEIKFSYPVLRKALRIIVNAPTPLRQKLPISMRTSSRISRRRFWLREPPEAGGKESAEELDEAGPSSWEIGRMKPVCEAPVTSARVKAAGKPLARRSGTVTKAASGAGRLMLCTAAMLRNR